MKIIVLVKEVPDTWGERKLHLETGLATRDAGESVLDEIGERGVEVALTHRDENAGTEVVLLSMGPDSASTTLRKGLAMGADRAIHVVDEALHGADLGTTAQVLAAAIRREGFDLVIAGNVSTDGSGGVVPSMVAELLGVPAVTGLGALAISNTEVKGRRICEDGVRDVVAPLPAMISITEALPDGRFPNFKGIMSAKKKPLETLTAADLAVNVEDESRARSIVIAVSERPARAAGIKIVDEGDAGEKLAEFLVSARLA